MDYRVEIALRKNSRNNLANRYPDRVWNLKRSRSKIEESFSFNKRASYYI
jgi:hypothetical protein